MARCSRGTLFLMMASHYARKTGEVDDAIPYLTRAIEECGRLELTPNVYLNELGLCHFMKLDWERAAEVFERLVFNDDNEFELKAFVALQLRYSPCVSVGCRGWCGCRCNCAAMLTGRRVCTAHHGLPDRAVRATSAWAATMTACACCTVSRRS